MTDMIPTPTIGEILAEEFLNPLEMTPYRLSKELHVSTSTVLDLVHGRRRLSTDMALRLSKLFGTSERFWINLQTSIDVRNRKAEMESELEKIHPIDVSA
jgi:antitoxin HigA-1